MSNTAFTSSRRKILLSLLIASLCATATLAKDRSDDPILGFDYATKVSCAPKNTPCIFIYKLHPGMQAERVGLQQDDKILNVEAAPFHSALDANPALSATYPTAEEILGYIDRIVAAGASNFTLTVDRNGQRRTFVLYTSYSSTTQPRAPDSKTAEQQPPTQRPAYAYAHATSLSEQQAQCYRDKNQTACLHLEAYDELADKCRAIYDIDACNQALFYPFADKTALPSARNTGIAFKADADQCRAQRDLAACDRAIASPAATVADHARRQLRAVLIEQVRTLRQRRALALQVQTELQRMEDKRPPPKTTTASTPPAKTVFTTSFFVMLTLAAAMLTTAVLSTPIPMRFYDRDVAPPAPITVANGLHRYLVSKPFAALRILGSLILIALALWFALTFTLLAVIAFTIAGVVGLYAALRKPN